MDDFNEKELRALCNVLISRSVTPIAIVSREFVFLTVNKAWCDIFDKTPADFIGKSFEDITPDGVRELDVKNAALTIRGLMSGYTMKKSYQWIDTIKEFLLIASRVPQDGKEPFVCFVSQAVMLEQTSVEIPFMEPSRSMWQIIIDFIGDNWKKIAMFIGALIGTACLTFFQG